MISLIKHFIEQKSRSDFLDEKPQRGFSGRKIPSWDFFEEKFPKENFLKQKNKNFKCLNIISKNMDVKIIIDDETIQVNDFVQKIIGNMITGAVTSLKNIDEDWSTITITIKK